MALFGINKASGLYVIDPAKDNTKDLKVQVTGVKRLSSFEVTKYEKQFNAIATQQKNKKEKVENRKSKAPAHKYLRKLIQQSTVVADSHTQATKAFKTDAKFNKVQTSVFTPQQLAADRQALAQGKIEVLAGKGIMSSNENAKTLSFSCDVIRNDSKSQKIAKNTTNLETGMKRFSGDQVKASELIPGTPLGQYYNEQRFSPETQIVYYPNGDKGLTGFVIPLKELEKTPQALFYTGALSGCLSVVGQDGKNMYLFHAGKDGNDSSSWSTNKEGARCVAQTVEQLVGKSGAENVHSIQDLVNFCAQHFKQSVVQYCGHGERLVVPKNVTSFDYNTPQKGNPLRVGNCVTSVAQVNGKLQINVLSDDMKIDSTNCQTQSLVSKITQLV